MLKKIAAAASQAVLGTSIEQSYDIGKQVASGGPGYLWRLHTCTRKATGQQCTAFVFDKRQMERYSKAERELIYDVLRKGPATLTKLRHPRLLEIHHPLIETPHSMVFIAEAVFASLGNVLGRYENLPSLPLAIKEFQLETLSKQIGLQQVVEAIEFCHTGAKLVHANLTPEDIYLDADGNWKTGGFQFSFYTAYPGQQAHATFTVCPSVEDCWKILRKSWV